MDPGELEHYNRQQHIMLQNISSDVNDRIMRAYGADGTRTLEGVCMQKIAFDLVDGYVHHLEFVGGCSGNTKGVAYLAEGMAARDVADRLRGIPCQGANSCPPPAFPCH